MTFKRITAAVALVFLGLFGHNAAAFNSSEAAKVTTILMEKGNGQPTTSIPVTFLDHGYYKWAFIINGSKPKAKKKVLLIVKGDMDTYGRILSNGKLQYNGGGDLSTSPLPQTQVDQVLNNYLWEETDRIQILRKLYGFPMVQLLDSNGAPNRFKCIENVKYTCFGYIVDYFDTSAGWTFFKWPEPLVRYFETTFTPLDKASNTAGIEKLIASMKSIFQPTIAISDLQGFIHRQSLQIVLTDPLGTLPGTANAMPIVAINKVIKNSNYYKKLPSKAGVLLPMPRSLPRPGHSKL